MDQQACKNACLSVDSGFLFRRGISRYICQVLQQKNLTNGSVWAIIFTMRTNRKTTRTSAENTAETVRRRIEAGGEQVWRLADFAEMPFMAVAQTLSRLAR